MLLGPAARFTRLLGVNHSASKYRAFSRCDDLYAQVWNRFVLEKGGKKFNNFKNLWLENLKTQPRFRGQEILNHFWAENLDRKFKVIKI